MFLGGGGSGIPIQAIKDRRQVEPCQARTEDEALRHVWLVGRAGSLLTEDLVMWVGHR